MSTDVSQNLNLTYTRFKPDLNLNRPYTPPAAPQPTPNNPVPPQNDTGTPVTEVNNGG